MPITAEQEKQDESCVAEIYPEISYKHPLKNSWSIWYFMNNKNKKWEDNLIEIKSFDTAEDFWALYNHLEVASKLNIGTDYAVFKTGIKPMWEDKKNIHGGRWIASLQKFQADPDINSCWLEVLLCLIGEAFDSDGDEICGAVVQNRAKFDKLGLWTADKKNKHAIVRIGQILKDRLHLQEHPASLAYESHSKYG